jgi:O-antigen ligase
LQRYSGLTHDTRRDYLRTRALDQVLDHPAGLGIGGYGLNMPVLSPRPAVPYPHNIVLEVANESGLIALDALLALVGVALLMALRLARRPGLAFCAVGITFAFIEALASGSVNDNGVLWMLLGLTYAAARTIDSRAAGNARTT